MVWCNPVISDKKTYWQDKDKVLIRCDKCGKINFPVNGALVLLKDEQDLVRI
jgi:hypothetical protein